MPEPLFWPQPRLDPLPIVFKAVGDLGTSWLPWAWPPPSAHGRQPVWQDGSQPLGGLGEGLCHGGASGPHLCSQSLKTPALAIWDVGGHSGNCSSLEDQEFLRQEGKDSSKSLVPCSCFLHICCCRGPGSPGPVGQKAQVFAPTVLSPGLGDPCCTHHEVCTVRKGPGQLDYLGLDLSSNVSVVSPKLQNKQTKLKLV